MQNQSNALVTFLPLIILGVILSFVLIPISKRKGINRWLTFVLIFVPFVNLCYIPWLISLTDVSVKNKLAELEKAITQKQ